MKLRFKIHCSGSSYGPVGDTYILQLAKQQKHNTALQPVEYTPDK